MSSSLADVASPEAIEKYGLADRVTHVSTGGGAFLESLEGKSFNSLEVIPDLGG